MHHSPLYYLLSLAYMFRPPRVIIRASQNTRLQRFLVYKLKCAKLNKYQSFVQSI